ncbi:MAG: N,N-dimethylformamidase beta subunit family domain-containing protein [Pirellulales bacterium]
MHDDVERLSRREAVGRMAAAGSAAFVASGSRATAAESPIVAENARPGTRDWLLTNVKVDDGRRSAAIEGYCSHTSIRAGETLSIFVSTRPVSRFTLQIYRTGFYGGDGARLMADLGEFAGAEEPDPPLGEKRLRRCEWKASTELKIPADWPSGVYVGKLTSREGGLQSYVIFIVRDDRPADFLFQCSDFTWQAYNRWPNRCALYDDGRTEWYWGPNVQVSFDRPYGKFYHLVNQPLSTGSGDWFLWEFPLAYWMESQGYDVSYISNLDTHRDPARLSKSRGFLSVGHDEYWTIEMFRNVQAAIAAGTSVGFFSGNAVFGKVKFDDSQRAFERVGVFGPPQGTHQFAAMNTLAHERPYGNELMGAHSTGEVVRTSPWICTAPDHWIYAGTGMKQGDQLPGVIGWEFHGDPAPIPGLEIIATGPPGVKNPYTATVYPGPKGNIVFNAATCWWADGVAAPPGYVHPPGPKGPHTQLQRITKNVLDRMLAAQPPRL